MKTNKFYRVVVSLLLGVILAFSATACSETPNVTEKNDVTTISVMSTLSVYIDETYTLQATLMPFGSKAKVSWLSSDPEIATVSDAGVVKGIKAGIATVRANAGGKHADCRVTVIDPDNQTIRVSSVTVTPNRITDFNVGDNPIELSAKVLPENAEDKSLTWASDKVNVATVSSAGVVTAVGPGTARITATASNGQYGVCRVTVGGDGEDEDIALYVKKIDSLEGRNDFIMGMDASAVPSLEDANVVYKDFDGSEKDVFQILSENGITDIRIRIWNYPYQDGHYGEVEYSYGGGNCDLENAVAIAERCEQYGLGVILDFHYSDFWADPGKQQAPKAWKNKSVAERKNAIYDFTKDCLEEIQNTEVKITMVQVGNETTRSICEANFGTADYCDYINAGARAVRDVTGPVAEGGAKVAIHLTNPESRDFGTYAQEFKDRNVDYDVFGSSYYPFWHGTTTNLATNLKKAHDISGKEVMILETSYAFTEEDFDGTGNTLLSEKTKPFTVQGQSNAVLDVIETIADLGDYGLGICYWEGTWVAPADNKTDSLAACNAHGCGWASAKAGPTGIGGDGYQASDVTAAGGVVIDNQAFFDSATGIALKSLQVFKLAKTGQITDLVADYIYAEQLYYTVNDTEIEITLPAKVTVVLNEGSETEVKALWDVTAEEAKTYINAVNDYEVTGTTEFGGKAVCTIFVQNKNLLVDGSFEDTTGYGSTDNLIDVPSPWIYVGIATPNVLQLYVSDAENNAKMGVQSLHFWDSTALEFKVYQEIDVAAAVSVYGYGIFSFSFDFQGGDCGTHEIYSYAVITYNDGKNPVTLKGTDAYANGWKVWSRSELASIEIDGTVASVQVGFYLKAEGNGWGNFDNAQFFFRSEFTD